MLRATWSNVSELRLCINELYILYREQTDVTLLFA